MLRLTTEAEILALLSRLYHDIGGDPRDLVRVAPLYGGWYNALKFEVVRADNAKTWIWRKDMDAADYEAITTALRGFSVPR
ncbi:MAG TPA: hypothetical protein VGO08_10315 [Burkholderiales bacterium]|jgi:hypothetical protein|nr:hypothetical protein [Burkholderiales bacterium]